MVDVVELCFLLQMEKQSYGQVHSDNLWGRRGTALVS